jgi:hypothetical protein
MINAAESKSIAKALTEFAKNHPDRVRIRYSNGGDVPFAANAEHVDCNSFVCPQQTGKVKNCGDCGLCWTTPKPVTFLGHARAMKDDHNSIVNATTVFQKTIKGIDEVKSVLKLSANEKLGKKVTRGIWKDHIFLTLTLTERETCPMTCVHWKDCYGNGMRFAQRIKTDGLMEQIDKELSELNPSKNYLIRLHVLGDFYSVEYVEFWNRMMDKYSNIKIFGYTAHAIDNSHLDKKANLRKVA